MTATPDIIFPPDSWDPPNDITNPDLHPAEDDERPQHDPSSQSATPAAVTADSEIVWHDLTFDTDLPSPAYLSQHPPTTRPPPPPCPDLTPYTSPFLWSPRRKRLFTALSATSTMLAAYSAGAYTSGEDQMAAHWHVSRVAMTLGVTVFTVGFAVAPMVLAPFSEINGRRPMFVVTGLLFVLFQLVCALTPTYAGMLVARFLVGCAGSTFSTMVGGIVSDIYHAQDRNTAMSLFAGGALFGTGLGPVISGLIAQHTTWRWIFYHQVIMDASSWPSSSSSSKRPAAPSSSPARPEPSTPGTPPSNPRTTTACSCPAPPTPNASAGESAPTPTAPASPTCSASPSRAPATSSSPNPSSSSSPSGSPSPGPSSTSSSPPSPTSSPPPTPSPSNNATPSSPPSPPPPSSAPSSASTKNASPDATSPPRATPPSPPPRPPVLLLRAVPPPPHRLVLVRLDRRPHPHPVDRARPRRRLRHHGHLQHLPRRLQLPRRRLPPLRQLRPGGPEFLPQHAVRRLPALHAADVPRVDRSRRGEPVGRHRGRLDGRAVGAGVLWAEDPRPESVRGGVGGGEVRSFPKTTTTTVP
ncbi:Fungal trichothecene efflux pump (TRI12) [Teratosphaeria destructans]|uniref:Fungal trichothecene efflux pump (TRI12) n=1 Tax=Teratosphaeria destructans TaxID=418781 RepID=A0A9W7SQY8_9PEZI|nr:Fungal trichothecene efflux pump (TRI12) [Teratosphaeria destructans]